MKLFLSFLAVLFLNQNVFATGMAADDSKLNNSPSSSTSSSMQAGSTFQSAVKKGDQPDFCPLCEANEKARLSNSVGVVNTGSGGVLLDSSGKPVKSGQ